MTEKRKVQNPICWGLQPTSTMDLVFTYPQSITRQSPAESEPPLQPETE